MTILNKSIFKILQILIYLFPLSFIFGNLAINIFILLISFLGILYYNKSLLFWSNKKILFLTLSFFFILIISTYNQVVFENYYKDSIKSLLFLRYLFLLLVIKTMVAKNDIKISYFFFVCLVISLGISIDIVIQFIFNKNLIGLYPIEFDRGYGQNLKYFTGIFGKELIAGGFIQMFSILGIFSIFLLSKPEKKIIKYLIFFLLVVLFLFSISLTGNRMPLIMFMFFLIISALIIRVDNKKSYFLATSLVVFLVVTLISLKSDLFIKRWINFYTGIPNPNIIIKEFKKEYPELKKYENSGKQFHNLEEFKDAKTYKNYPFYTGHLSIYLTSLDLFADKPILGRGIKSFRNNCTQKIHLPNRTCENHPHNFTLEILNDMGTIGFFSLFMLVVYLLIVNYKEYKLGGRKITKISNWVYLTIILALFIQLVPFKSSGSFFSTYNAAYTFLIIGFLIGLDELRYIKQKDKDNS